MQSTKSTEQSTPMPSGIPYIIGNEAAERFSYYGMKAILVVFMTSALMAPGGIRAPMSEQEAVSWYHTFNMANYFFPILGALISDILWGKYKTIIVLSLVYCLGHAALAIDDTRTGLLIGLGLIALGAGGIKPCVSAHVGDQFSASTAQHIPKIFAWFYLSVNLGAFFSSLSIPWVFEHYGSHVAFAIPGILMLLATLIFWWGRNTFRAIPAAGYAAYKADILSREGIRAIKSLGLLFLFIAIFWSLYDQTGSTWVLQAEHLDRHIDFGLGIVSSDLLKVELLPAQIQAINPILILILTPLLSLYFYPRFQQRFKLTPIRKIAYGLALTSISFLIIAWCEQQIRAGHMISVMWQCLAYFVITVAEILVSITSLEYAYTQAPHRMKSFIMAFYMLAVSLGNAVTAFINFIILDKNGSSVLDGPIYFIFFAGMMAVCTGLFLFCMRNHKEQMYLHGAPSVSL